MSLRYLIDFAESIHDFDSDASTNRHASQDTDRSRGLYSSSIIHNVSDDLVGLAETHVVHRTFILQAIIIGTTFVHTPDSTVAYFSRGGVLFL